MEPGLRPARHRQRRRHRAGLRRRPERGARGRPPVRPGPAQRRALGRLLARRRAADDQRLGDHLGEGVGRADEAGAAEIVNIPGRRRSRLRVGRRSGRRVGVGGRGRRRAGALRPGHRTTRAAAAEPPWDRRPSECLWLSPDGRLLAVTGWDTAVPGLDTRTGKVAFVVGDGVRESPTSSTGTDPASGSRWRSHERRRTTPGRRRTIVESHVHVYDRTGAEVGRVSGEPDIGILSLGFRGDGDVIATTGTSSRQEPDAARHPALGLARGPARRTHRGQRIPGRVRPEPAICWSAPGSSRASSDVWDAGTGDRVSTLEGHPGIVTDLAFDAAGERVATAGADGSVRIWDPRTGRQQLALRLATPLARDGRGVQPRTASGSSPSGPTASPGSGPSTSTNWSTSPRTG